MKKLIVILLIPLSAFAQKDINIRLCSNLNLFGRLGTVVGPLVCSEDRKTGFSITVCVREINDTLHYYGLTVHRQGIGGKMDSAKMVLNYIDGTKYEMVSFKEKNHLDCSYFDEFGEYYDNFLKKKIVSIEFINLNNGRNYLHKLKPEQVYFFNYAKKEISKNKFYVEECN